MIHRGLVFWSVAAVATAVGLFTVKYKVQDLEERIDRTNHKIVESQQATHMLRVEWAHLNEAERIEKLAQKLLKLEPASIKQVIRLDSLKPESVPPRRDPPLPSPPRTGNDVPS
ncbi:MAG: cell division protein FtsL, partial [Reyranella sp.]|nr:cell division protein FtsL [Reyranella sp.]